jgi:hypothetical protein
VATHSNWSAFKIVSVLAAALYAALFVSLLVFPASSCRGFGLTVSDSLILLARRASMLMLGFSALAFLSRNAQPSPLRRAISFAVGINMAGFAASGTYELLRGALAQTMWGAVAVEVTLAVLYFGFWVRDGRSVVATPGA